MSPENGAYTRLNNNDDGNCSSVVVPLIGEVWSDRMRRRNNICKCGKSLIVFIKLEIGVISLSISDIEKQYFFIFLNAALKNRRVSWMNGNEEKWEKSFHSGACAWLNLTKTTKRVFATAIATRRYWKRVEQPFFKYLSNYSLKTISRSSSFSRIILTFPLLIYGLQWPFFLPFCSP